MRLLFLICSLLLAGCQSDGSQKVFKYDGSVQCSPGSGIAVDVMALELTSTGIDVICAQKGHDGMIYVAACGAGTGSINVYTIHSANLKDAEVLGFKSVATLPEYRDSACR